MKSVLRYCCLCILLGSAGWSCLVAQPKAVTILHTNDMHASFVPHEAYWVRTDPKPMVGGFLELGWKVDSIRNVRAGSLVLDGGDVMTGNPIAEILYKGAYGGALFEMMNAIGYDAWTIGNHDLDISQANLKKLTEIAKFATTSANLVDSAGGFPFANKQYLIIDRSGLRIGVIGLMSEDLFNLTNTNNLVGLKVLPVAQVLQKVIDEIGGRTDLIIALTHEGVEEDSVLATKVHGLDVIIGAHSHTRLRSGKQVNGVIICQTGSNCENLGELDLTVENHKVTSFEEKLIPLWIRPSYPENPVYDLVKQFREMVQKEYGEVICTLKSDLRRSRGGESNIGHLIAGAIRQGTDADVAVTNSAGIRKDLAAGSVTKLDVFEVLPFRNYLCAFKLTGKELRSFIQRSVQAIVDGRTSLEFSGFRCTWKSVGGRADIDSLTIGGTPINDDHIYRCGTIDYVINQADRYLGFVPKDVSYSQTLLFQSVVDQIKSGKVLGEIGENHFQEVH